MTAPITREEARALAKNRAFPDFVMQAFNELITGMILRGEATLLQEDAMQRVLALGPTGITREDVYSNHWLDVEEVYIANGWKMKHHKPAYYEDWAAYWSIT